MRFPLLRITFAATLLLLIKSLPAQNCFSSGLNGTVINLPCNVNCTQLSLKVPHIKSSSDYVLTSIPYNPYPWLSASGTDLTDLYTVDDRFINTPILLPFPFCFYDSTYTKGVAGSNGILTFDESTVAQGNSYPITFPIPYAGGTPNSTGTAYYPPASIMAAFSDLDPRVSNNASPADRRIQWRLEGTAPCRRMILTYYRVGVFGNTCGNATPNTFQIVIYESTGIIEIYFERKACFPTTNGGNAILGIQNWQRNKAVAAPGKNATNWLDSASGYRFVPSGTQSRFVKSELYNMSGTLLHTTTSADTATTSPGLLDINFPTSICPTAASTQYIVKTYFASCADVSTQIISSDTVTVNKTTSLSATATATPAACGPNGSIAVNIPAGAGTLPYAISLDAGLPVMVNGQTFTFPGVTGGAHTVQISTPGGCAQTINVTVPVTGTLTVQSVVTPTSCNGASNGAILVTPFNGVAPFTFSINGGAAQSNNVFSNLPPGNYTIRIADNSGCVLNNYAVTVPTGSTIPAQVQALPPACPGANNGSITITPSGTPPYQYSINGGALQPGNTFTNLPSGTYFISVRDAQNCTSGNITITVPVSSGSLIVQAVTTGTSCTGANNGSIAVTAMSGSGPYQYSLNGGTTWNPGTVVSGLAAGTYTIIIKDNSGCTSAPQTVVVAQGSALQANATATNASCTGVNNGTITVTPTNGAGPYSYTLDGTITQSAAVFTGVGAGNHTVVVTDGAGCVSAPIPVTVGVAAAITGSTVASATTCAGASNGSVVVTPQNGVGPYQYALDGGSFGGANNFGNLSQGAHSVVIRDNVGCVSASIPFTITAGPALTATASTTTTSCSGATNGTITVTPSVAGTYQYSIDGGTTYQSSATFTGLAAQGYTITYNNALGCTGTLQATVAAGQPLTATVAPSAVSCNGGNNGSATVTVTAPPTAVLSYSLDGTTWQTSATFTGLTAGNYTAYFRDNNNCSGTQPFVITEPTALAGSVTRQAVTCNGLSNGVLSVTASGGTAPYQYSIDGANYQSAAVFNVPAGIYTVYIRDAANCVLPITAQAITEPAALTATVTTTNASCAGGADGSIVLSAGGGVAPYQYALGGGAYQASSTFNVVAGNYNLIVRDANGCTFPLTGVVVSLTNNLVLTPMNDTVVCESKGVLIGPATNATLFRWSPGLTLSDSTIRTPVATPVATTDYIITASLGLCSARDTIRVTMMPAPVASAGVGDTICFGQTASLLGSGGVAYEWTPTATIINGASSASATVKPAQSTQYSLYVTDANGCRSLQSSKVIVVVTPPFNVYINPPDTVAYIGDTIQLNATSIGTTYQWSPATGLSDPDIKNPVLTVSASQVYTVTATTAAGCSGTATFGVQAFQGPEIYVPNAFTPNRDGKNELLRPFPVGVRALRYFKVFNRWGQEVYSWSGNTRGPEVYNLQNRTDIGWNGTINGAPQGTQTFVWVAEGITREGKVIQRKGSTVLIR